MDNRVVVTGIGLVSPAGNSIEDAWKSWENGLSSTDKIPKYKLAGAQVNELIRDDFLCKLPFQPTRATEFALAALVEALEKAHLSINDIDPYNTGVIIGGSPSFSNAGNFYGTLFDKEYTSVEDMKSECVHDIKNGKISLEAFQHSSCGYHPASAISCVLGIRKLSRCVSNACAAGADSVCMGYDLVKSGKLSTAITGGSSAAINMDGLSLLSVLDVLSKGSDYPHACKPFDKNRDGFVLGEGAGIIILESLAGARTRGAPIFAEILGYSTLTDTYHITTPNATGVAVEELICAALDSSGVSPLSVDYINASGTATYYSDLTETNGIKRAFGERAYDIPVSSLKSMIGHLMTAAGSVELIATILTIIKSVLLPTINYETPDPDCDLDYVANHSRKKNVKYAISNSFGFGGQNTCVVVGGL